MAIDTLIKGEIRLMVDQTKLTFILIVGWSLLQDIFTMHDFFLSHGTKRLNRNSGPKSVGTFKNYHSDFLQVEIWNNAGVDNYVFM
jgi:hypothetical protein